MEHWALRRWNKTLREIREKNVDTITRDQNEGITGQSKPINEVLNNDIILKAVLKKLGKTYKYKQRLGGGGFSNVHLIKHTIFVEYYALKIMDYDYIKKRLENQNIEDFKKEFNEIKERFITEAKLYKRIKHKNIVRIKDVYVIEDEKENVEIPYITMNYIKGSSLDRSLKNKVPLEWRTSFDISMNVLDALDAIHKAKVIHRDIKPANIMIKEETGKAILIDFGLAKDKLNETKLTASGAMMGTPAYMSPEQFDSSKNVDSTTDIYSFGAVLYEMLAGEVPFNGKNQLEIMYGHLYKPVPSIREKNSELPKGIENIIFTAMAKEPKDRYKSAGQFRDAIRQIDETHKRIVIDRKDEDAKPGESITRESNEILERVRSPYKPYKYKYLVYISVIIVAAIAVFIFLKSSIPKWQYNGFISSAKTFIESKDWETAVKTLNKAKEIKDTPEVERLLSEIAGEKIEAMKREFDDLKAFLKGDSSNKDKLEKCREFLAKHEGIPGNGEKTAIISEINNSISNLEAAVKQDEEYRNPLNIAGEYIKKGDYQKAVDTLEKARTNRGTDTVEIAALSKEIEEKQIKAMIDDFEALKKFLASGATEKEKIEKSRAFLGKHQNIPENSDTKAMRDETNRFISDLNTKIKADEQYQQYIDVVNRLIESKDYEKAKKELNKAMEIKHSEEGNRLSERIEEKWFNAIEDKPTIRQYQSFQREYPNSVHLLDLKDRLPPEEYWDKSIELNEKGYYERTFDNGHRMVYIPKNDSLNGFWIDKYEVSWAQYMKFLNEARIASSQITDDKIIHSGGEYPVVIAYKNARNYCNKYGLSLPTGAEWEYAAGKGKFLYPWGNESPDENGIWRANYDSLEGIIQKDGFKGTAPVKSFEKFSSPFGIVNMSGNVWEWVQGNILKGGGFFSSGEDLKIKSSKPGNSDEEGFRCIKLEK
jgi:serine/threonine protein kinase